MRKLLAALLLFGLGIGGAVIVAKPASARTTIDGTLTGVVGPGASISLKENGATVTNLAPGTYEFDITDSATTHNFDICAGSAKCTNPGTSIDSTSVAGTGSTVWDITLSAGTYRYQCDVHFTTMVGTFTVGTATTTSTTSTTTTTQTTTTTPTTTSTTTTVPTTTTTTTSQTTTTTPTTTTTTTTTTTQPTTTSTPPPPAPPLVVHIVSAKGTTHSVVVKVSSSKHGKAVAQLMKGSKRLAKSSHTVPGTITLKPSRTLKPGRYTVKVAVTAGGKHATVKKTVKIT